MNMGSKSLKLFAMVTAVVGSVWALLQYREIGDLRFQNEVLRSAHEPAAVRADTQTDSTAEMERLRRENLDLLKLRNQVRQLRSQLPELAGARAENQRLLQDTQKS